jgi:hypothetical protein
LCSKNNNKKRKIRAPIQEKSFNSAVRQDIEPGPVSGSPSRSCAKKQSKVVFFKNGKPSKFL